ncbi:MAG: potassium channel family protein [Ignavibacteria bacterium]|nr:potassium channel family protein [Ignavibacteria bacterium]
MDASHTQSDADETSPAVVPAIDSNLCYKLDRSDKEERQFLELVKRKLKSGDYRFSRFVFRQDLTLAGISFHNTVDFSHARFFGTVHFMNAQFLFTASFRHATFVKAAIFSDAVFHHRADFGSALFMDEASFMGAIFHDDADFVTVKFHGEATFYKGEFRKDCIFRRAQFVGGATFENVSSAAWARFDGATSPNGLPVTCTRASIAMGKGSSFYRLAKQSSQSSGDYISAGKYHYRERCHMWSEHFVGASPGERLLLFLRSPSLLIEFVFGRMIFGYGERVTRPLVSGIVLILLFAVLFMVSGIQSTVDPMVIKGNVADLAHVNASLVDRMGYCVYFSAVTFATLGYGDFRPAGSLSRVLANVESLLGIVLGATFAVSLTKKYTRG